MDSQDEEIIHLEPKAIFGFAGMVRFGLLAHPDEKHIVYAVGSKITVLEMATNKQTFITGHTNFLTCLDFSPKGDLLASGQLSPAGFPAYAILTDWATKTEIGRHDLHKCRVQAITFTAHSKYMISLGGEDDGTIIVYDVENRTSICQALASKCITGTPTCICRFNTMEGFFIVAGDQHLRIWSIDGQNKKASVHDASVGKIKRIYSSIRCDARDSNIYLTTNSGDLVKVCMSFVETPHLTKEPVGILIGTYAKWIPKGAKGKDCEKFVNGLRSMCFVRDKTFILGAGDGTVALVEERNTSFKNYPLPTWPGLKVIHTVKVRGAVSSLTRFKNCKFIIGTEKNEIYEYDLKIMKLRLLRTCHKTFVHYITFPTDFSLVFATASHETIRIWSTKRMQELLRIMVFNFTCSSIKFTTDGTKLLSAWNDGYLRAFTPITGKLIWAIPNAHNKGCSAITISTNGRIMVSGGVEGQVRVWKIETIRQSLLGVLKEHSAPISSVDFNKFDTEVVSASHDGSCVIWDIQRMTRKHVFYANTQFMCASYYPTGVQILTSGSNHRICFWEVYDGSLVRELEGSRTSVNFVSISKTGEYFVSVANDQKVKLWDYQKGITVCSGTAHSAAVISCQYSPSGKFFVTGSVVGEVLIWDIPKQFWPKQTDPFSKAIGKDTDRNLGDKKKEKIEEIETKRKDKDLLCTECPAGDPNAKPDVNEKCNYIPNLDEKGMCRNY